MKRDTVWGFFIGVLFAAWMMHAPWGDTSKYRNAIKECEKTLPRNQHCVVTGVPESWQKPSEKK